MATLAPYIPSGRTNLGSAFITGSPSSLSPALTSLVPPKRMLATGRQWQLPLVLATAANDMPPAGFSRRQLFTLTAMSAAMTAVADSLVLTRPAEAAIFPGVDPGILNPGKYGSAAEQDALRSAVASVLDPLISIDPSANGNAGALLRLAFHDAFTRDATGGGANGSILFEKLRRPNTTLTNAFAVVESALPAINAGRKVPISMADLIQLAGAQAVAKAGGPTIVVPIGRSDVLEADPDGLLPPPFANVTQLKTDFLAVRLDEKDLVALSGAHTIGLARTSNTPLDTTPASFDNAYFSDILARKGIFPSDNALNDDPVTKSFVQLFSTDLQAFFTAFTEAYIALSLVGWRLPTDPACFACPVGFDYDLKVVKVNGSCPFGGFPDGKGLCPDANGRYPNGAGQYPDCNGRYPDGKGKYPDCNGRYPDGGGRYPSINGVYP